MYAIKYYRDPETVRRYLKHGITFRPVAYVTGQARYEHKAQAQADADHINALGPPVPVTVVSAGERKS